MITQTLIIAEKPSVAQTIAAALGVKNKKDGYIEGNLKKVKLFICTLMLTMTFVSASPVSASETPSANTNTNESSPEAETTEKIVPYCNLEDPS